MVFFHKVEPEKGMLRKPVRARDRDPDPRAGGLHGLLPGSRGTREVGSYIILGWTLLGGIYLLVRNRGGHTIDLDYAFRDLGEKIPSGALATEPHSSGGEVQAAAALLVTEPA